MVFKIIIVFIVLKWLLYMFDVFIAAHYVLWAWQVTKYKIIAGFVIVK